MARAQPRWPVVLADISSTNPVSTQDGEEHHESNRDVTDYRGSGLVVQFSTDNEEVHATKYCRLTCSVGILMATCNIRQHSMEFLHVLWQVQG